MYYAYNGKILEVNKVWDDVNGVTHSKDWYTKWSHEEKTKFGLVQVQEEVKMPNLDNKLYWGYLADGVTPNPRKIEDIPTLDLEGNPVIDELTGEPSVSKGLKTTFIESKKQNLSYYLSETDWYITRFNEKGIDIPFRILGWRDALRKACTDKENAISVCVDFNELELLVNSPGFNEWPINDGSHVYEIKNVTMRQARLALLSANLLDSIDLAITDPAAKIEWEYSDIVSKDSQLVNNLATNLGLTDADINNLFNTAKQL